MPYPVVELHCDTADRLAWQSLPAALRERLSMDTYGPGDENDPAGITQLARNHGHISLEKIGQVSWAQCFACYIPDELTPAQAHAFFDHVSTYLGEQVERNAPHIVLAQSAADIRPALHAGHAVAIRTIENATLFAEDPRLVAAASDLGVLMASLSWNAPGPLASGHDAPERGLTAAGRAVITEMMVRVGLINSMVTSVAAMVITELMIWGILWLSSCRRVSMSLVYTDMISP